MSVFGNRKEKERERRRGRGNQGERRRREGETEGKLNPSRLPMTVWRSFTSTEERSRMDSMPCFLNISGTRENIQASAADQEL